MDLGLANGIYSNKLEGNATGLYDSIRTGLHNGIYNQNLLRNNIVKNGLILYLDAAYPKSYPRTDIYWNDLSGKNSNCILNNGITYNQTNNGSLVFDGIDDFVSSTLNTDRITNISFSIWYKWNGINQYRLLSFIGDAAISGYGFFISSGAASSGNLLNLLFANLSVAALPTSATLSTSWANYVVTRDTLTTTLYQNANLISSTNTAPLTSTTYNFRVCGQSAASPNAAGNVGNVMFYNKCLTQSEINQNYIATKSRFNL